MKHDIQLILVYCYDLMEKQNLCIFIHFIIIELIFELSYIFVYLKIHLISKVI